MEGPPPAWIRPDSTPAATPGYFIVMVLGLIDRISQLMSPIRGNGRGWLLLSVGGGWLVILGMRFIVPALLPAIKQDFAMSNTAAGFAVTVIWLTYAGMQFPAGLLIDRVGERTLLAVSAGLSGVGVLAIGISPVFAVLLLASAIFGLGSGLYGPPRATVVSNAYPEHDGIAFGLILAAGSLGAAGMPVAASFIEQSFGWRAAVLLFAPVFAVFASALWLSVPSQHPETGTRSLWRNAHRIRSQLTRRPVVIAATGAMLMLFVFQGLTAFFPIYLVETKGLPESTAASLFAIIFVSGAVFQLSAGRAADLVGHGRVLVVCAGVSVLPLVALPFVTGVSWVALIAIVLGVRLAIGPVSNAYVVRVLADDVMGSTWGLVRTIFFIVGSTGSVVVGILADRALFDEAFFLLAGLTAVAGLIFLFLPRRADIT